MLKADSMDAVLEEAEVACNLISARLEAAEVMEVK